MPTASKSKKKQPQRKPKPKTKPKTRQPRIPPHLIHSVCGLTDPFCEHANGAKYPDDSSVRTLPWTFRTRGSLASSSSGDVAALIFPQLMYYPLAFPETTSGSTVLLWADFAAATALGTPSGYRIVSWGLRLRNVTAPLYASGMVHLRSWPIKDGIDMQDVDCLSYNATTSNSTPLQDVKDLIYIGEHTDQMPQVFYTPSLDGLNTANADTRGFVPLTVYVSGAPASTTVLEYEIVIHYELTFVPTDNLGMVATPAPPANPILTSAAAIVTSKAQSIFTRGLDALGDAIVGRATSALMKLTMPGRVASGVAMLVD